jgi:hypothetical protein
MMSAAHSAILRAADRGKPFCPGDPDAERYLIDNGYARYTEKPLMVLTGKAFRYARENAKWLKTGRTGS